ncbi:SDR family oxidoreductase [Rhodococcus sovatensis]|uniref:SDR family oxidoreductase n=1 Tax=Rhodococcus sovatensis TaxID=1805840 RepID=A0ABZ2PLC0_9NOCA
MPSRIRRCSANRRPRFPTSVGITGSTISQNSSLITPTRVIEISSLTAPLKFGRHALGLSQRFEDSPIEDWSAVLDTNVAGTVALVQGLVPGLAREAELSGRADVLTIGSISDENSYDGATIYGVASAALKAFATHLRRELRPQRIRVANIAPGYVRSPWAEDLSLTADDYARLGPDLIAIEDVAEIADFVLRQPAGVAVHELVVVSTKQGWG